MKTILLDVDGVLANFVQGSIEAHDMNGLFSHDDATSYDYFLNSPWCMTAKEFFKPLDTFEFWDSLPLYPEAQDLYCYLRRLPCDLFICTTVPSGSVHAASGKLSWLKRNFGIDSDSVVITRSKHLLAGENVMLIDDASGNIRRFRESGGSVVTVPRPWNERSGQRPAVGLLSDEIGYWVNKFSFNPWV